MAADQPLQERSVAANSSTSRTISFAMAFDFALATLAYLVCVALA